MIDCVRDYGFPLDASVKFLLQSNYHVIPLRGGARVTENHIEAGVPDLYANGVSITFNLYDFVLDFGLESPPASKEGGKQQRLVARIRMSPQHAKSISLVLENVLRRYEMEVGKINLPKDVAKRIKEQQIKVEDNGRNKR